jgi:pyruvate formate lyase activating enzyme
VGKARQKIFPLNALIFDIRHYTIHDGPGIRTTVFFKGCPLRCWWCHNPESQEVGVEQVFVERTLDGRAFESKSAVGSQQSAAEVLKEIEKDEVFYIESGGGVTFSGGEPLMQPDALQEILELCKEKGYHTAIDTSGHAEPVAVKKIMKLADLWLFDLKLINDIKHIEFTGVSNDLALKNLETLAKAGKEIIIRFPHIPGITDEPDNLEEIAAMMKRLRLRRIDILPYHAIAKEKYRRMGKINLMKEIKEPGEEKIEEVIEFFKKQGFLAGSN